MALTNAQMQAVINAGGVIVYKGVVYSTTASLPSDAQIGLDSSTAAAVSTPDRILSGSLGANGATVVFSTQGMSSLTVGLSGTWTATVAFEVTTDGTNWVAATAAGQGTSAAANGEYQFNVAGYNQFRLRVSAYTSGTANAVIEASAAVTPPINATPSGDNLVSAVVQAQADMGQTGTGLFSPRRLPNVVKNIAAQAITAGTPVAVWTPATGKKFRLLGFAVSLSVAGSVIFKDNTTEVLRTPLLAAGTGIAAPPMGNGILSAAANNALQIDASASGSVSGFVFGIEE